MIGAKSSSSSSSSPSFVECNRYPFNSTRYFTGGNDIPVANFHQLSTDAVMSGDDFIQSQCSRIRNRNERLDLRLDDAVLEENILKSALSFDVRKRRSKVNDEGPLAKRRVDKMSARFENFHISTKAARLNNRGKETLQDIEDRLSDSSDDQSNDLSEIESKGLETLSLSDHVREYIKRSLEEPIIVRNPVPTMAVVPYIARPSIESLLMKDRISEITDDNADGCDIQNKGFVTFPDEEPSIRAMEVHPYDILTQDSYDLLHSRSIVGQCMKVSDGEEMEIDD